MIVTQVAITVTLPAVAFFTWRPAAQLRSYDLGFPPEQYPSARLEMDRESSADVSGDTSRAAFLARFDNQTRIVVAPLDARVSAASEVSSQPAMESGQATPVMEAPGPGSRIPRKRKHPR